MTFLCDMLGFDLLGLKALGLETLVFDMLGRDVLGLGMLIILIADLRISRGPELAPPESGAEKRP